MEDVKVKLEEELKTAFDAMSDEGIDSDEYKNEVKLVGDLMDRDIKYEELRLKERELDIKERDLAAEKKRSVKDVLIRVGLPIAATLLQVISYWTACNRSLEIEFGKNEFVSSDAGKASMRKLMGFFK